MKERWLRFWADRRVRVSAIVGGGALALLVTFLLGVLVGMRESYRAFGPDFPPPFFLLRGQGDPNHGAIGAITLIDQDRIFLLDSRMGQSRTIHVVSSTSIERGRNRRIELQDLAVGDQIIAIGDPEDGMIRARFIRVLAVPTPEPGGQKPGFNSMQGNRIGRLDDSGSE